MEMTTTPSIQWQCLSFSALNVQQLYAILALRSEVFVVEQNCVYQDPDGSDPACLHLIGWDQSAGNTYSIAAYLRIVPPGKKFDEASIGRVITAPKFRACGAGTLLLQQGLTELQTSFPKQAIRIRAQAYLENFYGRFGFKPVSSIFVEDGIPHLEMLLRD